MGIPRRAARERTRTEPRPRCALRASSLGVPFQSRVRSDAGATPFMNSRGPVVVPPSGFIGVLGVGSAVHPNRNWTLHKAVSELIPRQSVEKSGRYSKVNAKAPFGGPAGEKIVTHGRSYPINLAGC